MVVTEVVVHEGFCNGERGFGLGEVFFKKGSEHLWVETEGVVHKWVGIIGHGVVVAEAWRYEGRE
jgi:hypothetical protein